MLDPLTALGLAGNIVQFVDFGLKLLSTSIEIVRSAKGATSLNLELDHAYTALQNFTSELKLEDDSAPDPPPSRGDAAADTLGKAHTKAIRPHIAAIQRIAVDCQAVCNELLDVVNGLRVDPASSKRRLKSLAAALSERQAFMTRVLASLEAQNSWLETQQSNRFKEISGQLDVLLHKIHALPRAANGDKREGCVSRSHAADKATDPHENQPQHLHPNNVEDLAEILSGLSLAEKDIALAAKVQGLLKSLHFKSRNDRHEAIHDAHKATFEWIFSDQKPTGSLDADSDHGTIDTDALNDKATPLSFTAWLESGRGIFWISGKPGAGKSTLMKFVADHARTRRLLRSRTQTKRVIVASHYFWSSGTPMQKSVKGLLQQLILDILCHCPELALDVFPHRLQKGTTAPWTINTKHTPAEDEWTIRELHQGLLHIANHPAVPIRCCFFIDGLDEYPGNEYLGDHFSEDHSGLCEILKDLATSENVQCCVSSRPLNVFDDAFGSRSGANAAFLHVHELTYNDVRLFARSRLQSITRWKDMGINDAQVESLVQYITDNAEGVFLWVFLVTKSLRDGVIDGDTFDDLHRRLKTIPTELNQYFKHMLDRVDAVHHSYMAQTLQVATNADRPLELSVYYVLEHELEDTNYALEWPPDFAQWRINLYPDIYRECRRRVNARCGGLLAFEGKRVEFIHRTVYDFLKNGPMQEYLQSKVALGFFPGVATLKALTFLFRCVVRTLVTAKGNKSAIYMRDLWDLCLFYAGQALIEDEGTATRLLDALADVQQNEPSDKFSFLQEAVDCILKDLVVFKPTLVDQSRGSRSKTLIAQQNMASAGDAAPPGLRHTYPSANVGPYVLAKLRGNPSYFDSYKVSLLGTALNGQCRRTDAHFVTALLEAGCDPNAEIDGWSSSPWELLLNGLGDRDYNILSTRVGCSLLTAFLRHGASRAPFLVNGQLGYCAVYNFLQANLNNYRPSERPKLCDNYRPSERPKLCDNYRLLERYLMMRRSRDDYNPSEERYLKTQRSCDKRDKLELHAVFEAVDVFLDTSLDNKRKQLADILCYIQTWKAFPPRTVSAEERVATVAFVDKMILMAVELCLHADEVSPLLANTTIRRHVSPSVLATLADYVQSHSTPEPDTLLSAPTTDLKRKSPKSEDEEGENCVKRSRMESSCHRNGTDPSNAIVID